MRIFVCAFICGYLYLEKYSSVRGYLFPYPGFKNNRICIRVRNLFKIRIRIRPDVDFTYLNMHFFADADANIRICSHLLPTEFAELSCDLKTS